MDKRNTFIEESSVIDKIYFDKLKDDLVCQICMHILNDPLMCSNCETCFCSFCIKKWLSSNNTCPLRCPKEKSNVVEINRIMKKTLDRLKLRCKYGCEVPLLSYNSHMISCDLLHKDDLNCWNCGSLTHLSKVKEKSEDDIANLKNEHSRMKENLKELKKKEKAYLKSNKEMEEKKQKMQKDHERQLERLKIEQEEKIARIKRETENEFIEFIKLKNRKEEATINYYQTLQKLKTKESILNLIQKLEEEYCSGESVETLKAQLEDYNLEMLNLDNLMKNLKLNLIEIDNEPKNNLITKQIDKISQNWQKMKSCVTNASFYSGLAMQDFSDAYAGTIINRINGDRETHLSNFGESDIRRLKRDSIVHSSNISIAETVRESDRADFPRMLTSINSINPINYINRMNNMSFPKSLMSIINEAKEVKWETEVDESEVREQGQEHRDFFSKEVEIISQQLSKIQRKIIDNIAFNDLQFKNYIGNNFLTLRLEGFIGNFKIVKNSKNKFYVIAESANLEYSYDEFGLVDNVHNQSYDEEDYIARSYYYYEENFEYHYDYEHNYDYDYCFDDYSEKSVYDINWEENIKIIQNKKNFEKFKLYFFPDNTKIIVEINNFYKIKVYNFEEPLKEVILDTTINIKCKCLSNNYFETVIKDKEVKIFNLLGNQIALVIGYESSSKVFDYSLNHLCVFDIYTGKILFFLCLDDYTRLFNYFTDYVIFAILRQNQNVITFLNHKEVFAFELMSKRYMWTIKEQKEINFLKLLMHKELILLMTGNVEGEYSIYSPEKGNLLFKINVRLCRNFIKILSLSNINKTVLIGREDIEGSKSKIYIWNLDNGELISTIDSALGKNQPKIFRLFNRQLVILTREDPDGFSSENKVIFKAWSPETGKQIRKIVVDNGGNKKNCYLVTQLSNYQDVLITANRNKIFVWNFATGEIIKTFIGHDGMITGLKILNHNDMNVLVSGEKKYNLRFWTI